MSWKSIVNRTLKPLGYQITSTKTTRYFNFKAFVLAAFEHQTVISFLQVGGCDGRFNDPLYELIQLYPNRFEGTIIEPVNDYFQELNKLYHSNPKIQPLRYAIHVKEKKMTLYRPDMRQRNKLPLYAKGVASFSRDHLIQFNIPDELILEEMVPCIEINELCEKQELSPELLLLDTEGYDFHILNMIDFKSIRPLIIRFEHGVSEGIMSRQQLDKVSTLLHDNGYDLIVEPFDAVAYRKEIVYQDELGAFRTD